MMYVYVRVVCVCDNVTSTSVVAFQIAEENQVCPDGEEKKEK